MPRIEMHSIGKSFPGVRALDGVSLSVEPGEVHALVGENGAGKSTLMKILSGVHTQYDGEIEIDGEVVAFQGPQDAERAGIAIIHQELNLVRNMTVAENIFLGREPLTRWGLVDATALRQSSRALLEQLGAAIHPQARVAGLRIGEQQMVEIAKALSLRAGVLIMDEPTSALSEGEVARLFEVVRALAARDVSILYISHKLDELFTVADRMTVLRDGRLVGTRAREEIDAQGLVNMMVGRDIGDFFYYESHATDRPLLEARGLCAQRPDKPEAPLLDNISFTLHEGEVLGIGGLMGAGRTELLEALFGILPCPVQGEILLQGRALPPGDTPAAIAAGLALVTEDRKALGLVETMSVGANITLAGLDALTRWGVVQGRREQGLVSRAIERLRVKTSHANAPVSTLSGGNQQKVIVARWLETQPKVLLLDEPTRGIDVGAKAEMYRLMGELTANGMGLILVSSELPELLSMSDRVMVLCRGRVRGILDREQATEQAVMGLAT